MRWLKFNPRLLTDDERARSFVVRTAELDRIVQIVRDNDGSTNQHVLVVGPRGFGKSTLVQRVALAVRQEDGLRERWFPLLFAEESYLVRTEGEFWLEALLHLADATGEARWRAAHDTLRKETDERRLRTGALGALLDFADERGVRLLFVVENLDTLLADDPVSAEQAWALRKTLLAERRVMVLGTAVHRFEGIDQPDQPWFELFRLVEIAPLHVAETDRLWAQVSSAPLGLRAAKAVRILCGGNPRLTVALAQFSRGRGLDDLLSEIDALIDDYTDYFRNNIEALPPLQRRVFLAAAELWEPATARQIGELARCDVHETSAVLSRLVKDGRVMVVGKKGKQAYYQVSERLYCLYVLIRRRAHADGRVRSLVDFIRHLFAPAARPSLLKEIAAEAQREPGARDEHLAVITRLVVGALGEPARPRGLAEQVPPMLLAEAHDLAWGPAPARSMNLLLRDLAEAPPSAGPALDAVAEVLRRADRRSEAQQVRALIAAHPSHAQRSPARVRLSGYLEGSESAMVAFSRWLVETEAPPVPELLDLATRLTAAGQARCALDALRGSPAEATVEPLLVALAVRLGEPVNAPREVIDVAVEVNRRIDAVAALPNPWTADLAALTLPDEVSPEAAAAAPLRAP